MRWLITGGCGFIGRNLVRSLDLVGGDAVRILDDLSVGTRSDLAAVASIVDIPAATCGPISGSGGSVEFIVGDITDEQLAYRVVAGADVIVHLAANTGIAPSVNDPRRDCLVNVIGTLNYLEAARGADVSRFGFASSGAPLGEYDPPLHEELAPRPVSPYGASKLAGEGYCSAYKRSFGIDTVVLRFGNVYGPLSGHKDSIVAKFIRQAWSGERERHRGRVRGSEEAPTRALRRAWPSGSARLVQSQQTLRASDIGR
jgi:UDP-glucose 4-epimerase